MYRVRPVLTTLALIFIAGCGGDRGATADATESSTGEASTTAAATTGTPTTGTDTDPTEGVAPPTYWQDVAPIYFTRCAGCHQDGGIAPFVLTDYASAGPAFGRGTARGRGSHGWCGAHSRGPAACGRLFVRFQWACDHTLWYGRREVDMQIVSFLAATVVVACLLVLAYIHVYWGRGGAWPARTRAELGPTVVGTPSGAAMPNLAACLVVAGLLVTAAGLVAYAGFIGPWWVSSVGSVGVGVVLALRGLGGFVDGRLRPATREQPFYALNRRIYSPLCLVLAALIALVLV